MNRRRVLIETSWNVKGPQGEKGEQGIRINRNIVECKDFYAGCSIIYNSVLIETSWNVKQCRKFNTLDQVLVLIETSWNVKKIHIDTSFLCEPVLIETSWNVKQVITSMSTASDAVLIETSWNVKVQDALHALETVAY